MSDPIQTQANLIARLRALSQWSGECDGSALPPGAERCEHCGGCGDGLTGPQDPVTHIPATVPGGCGLCCGKGYRVVLTVRPSEGLSLVEAWHDAAGTDVVAWGPDEPHPLIYLLDAVRWHGATCEHMHTISEASPMGRCAERRHDALRSECRALGIAWEEGS